MSDDIEIRIADLAEIIDLRSDVLIRGTVRVSPQFDGDTADETRHFGAFAGTTAVACASCMQSDYEGLAAWQLRGMATRQDRRSHGIGARLLSFIESEAWRTERAGVFWCNARVRAVPFYERAGWNTVSAVFEVAGVGPHRKMHKTTAR